MMLKWGVQGEVEAEVTDVTVHVGLTGRLVKVFRIWRQIVKDY